MCTVTFIARSQGYALGMNRDEKLARVRALPPAPQEIAGRTALFPSEPGGGTWIGVNDAGATYALINWYSVPARPSAHAMSRGSVVRSALGFDTAPRCGDELTRLPLDQISPFRLIGIFPHDRQVVEWRWNLLHLERLDHQWKTSIWISSGFDEPGAEQTRRETFNEAVRKQPLQSLRWLRRLHASHAPAAGPHSVCMHRDEAATVSYTEIVVTDSVARLAYADGAPCCTRAMKHKSLKRATISGLAAGAPRQTLGCALAANSFVSAA